MIWFTSDTHFGHENVLKFTDRPWETIWQMNDAIVDSINGRVAVDDELYILGDFSFKMTAQDAYGLRKRIACRRIHLVPGNHDKDWTQPAVAGAFTVEPRRAEGMVRRSRRAVRPGEMALVGQRDRRQAGRARAGGVQAERAIAIDRKKPR